MTILTLDQVLAAVGIDIADDRTAVLLRHTPEVPDLAAAMPALATEDHEAYDAFNAFHLQPAARIIRTRRWAVVGLADGPGVLVTGMYRIGPDAPISDADWQALPGNDRLAALGALGPADIPTPTYWFDLTRDDRLDDWSGRLAVGWSGRRGYVRVIRPQSFAVQAVHLESRLAQPAR